MISSLCFLPRGAAKAQPDQQELSIEEMNELVQKQSGMSLDELNQTGDDKNAEAADSESDADGDASMDDDEKKDAINEKEEQLLRELKMGQ